MLKINEFKSHLAQMKNMELHWFLHKPESCCIAISFLRFPSHIFVALLSTADIELESYRIVRNR